VVYICNFIHQGDCNQKDHSSKTAQAKIKHDPHLNQAWHEVGRHISNLSYMEEIGRWRSKACPGQNRDPTRKITKAKGLGYGFKW
jgi:hypothetical protein